MHGDCAVLGCMLTLHLDRPSKMLTLEASWIAFPSELPARSDAH